MVLGLFGGKKKENKAEVSKAEQDKVEAEKLERERKLVMMQKTLEEMKEKNKIGYKKLEERQNQIKELIRQKKKAEAKRQLLVYKKYQDELIKQENMTILLEKQKIELESAAEMTKMIDVLKLTKSLNDEAEKNREYLEDYLMDKKETDEQNREISNLLNDLAAGTEEERDEADALFREFEQEVLDEKMDDINTMPARVNTNTTKTNTNTTKQTVVQKQDEEEDDISKLMKEASMYN